MSMKSLSILPRILPRILPLSFAALLAACSPGHSQDAYKGTGAGFVDTTPQVVRKAPDSAAYKTSFSPVVKAASPAVVNVFATRVTRAQVDPFWQMFGGQVPRDQVEKSLGSGVIVRSDGIIVTNNHVIEGGQEFMVALSDRRQFPAKVLLADPRSDLAVLKLEAPGETFATLKLGSAHDLEVGDLVLAIGNPFGVGQTVTNGIISALDRTDVGPGEAAYIQTDAPINPGNSGGALVDMEGNLIGINSFILSRSGSSAGVGFAVPAAMVRKVVASATGGQASLVRPWLGVKGDAVTSDIARSLKMARPEGVLISDLYRGGPGEVSGLKVGDVVTRINGNEVNDPKALNYRIGVLSAGETATVDVLRSGKPVVLKARVIAPVSTPKDQRALKGNFPLTGATVINLSPAAADELGIDPFDASKGVMVFSIDGAAYAARAGLRPGDIIREINGTVITSTAQLDALLKAGARQWKVQVMRDGKVLNASFG
jgi:Do/DeqQ family serine protease